MMTSGEIALFRRLEQERERERVLAEQEREQERASAEAENRELRERVNVLEARLAFELATLQAAQKREAELEFERRLAREDEERRRITSKSDGVGAAQVTGMAQERSSMRIAEARARAADAAAGGGPLTPGRRSLASPSLTKGGSSGRLSVRVPRAASSPRLSAGVGLGVAPSLHLQRSGGSSSGSSSNLSGGGRSSRRWQM